MSTSKNAGSTKASTPNHSDYEESSYSLNGNTKSCSQQPPSSSSSSSSSSQKRKKYSSDASDDFYENVQQPKRKGFCSPEERKKFVDDYTRKLKTEMCKNWTTLGSCKFGEKCSFAHGKDQLQGKSHLHPNYKTKPCRKFFLENVCPYGHRCQYIHTVDELILKGHEEFLREEVTCVKLSFAERVEILSHQVPSTLKRSARLPVFTHFSTTTALDSSTDNSLECINISFE